ncbi:MAG TPA: four helix bundle protein [Anaerolineales bacterium]
MQDFKDLQVWQKAHELTIEVYRTTQAFPRLEQFGLTAQMRRASESIPANIAEGCGRKSQREFAQSLHLAIGSANELEYHLLLAADLSYVERMAQRDLDIRIAEVRKMLSDLARRVRSASKV